MKSLSVPTNLAGLRPAARAVLAGAAVAAVALAAAGCGPRPHGRAERAGGSGAPRPVTVLRVEADGAGGGLVLPARIAAREEVTITATIAGRLTALPLAEGRAFAEGATLARFEAPETRDALAAASAAVEAAGLRLELARTQETRLDTLYAERVAALRELEIAREARRTAEAAEAEARAVDTALRAGAEVVAPFAGVVVRHHVDTGVTLGPGQPVLDIRSAGAVEIVAAVPEAAAAMLRGARVEFQVGEGEWRPASLARVDGMTDFSTRTRTARFRSAAPGEAPEPGAFARVRILAPAGMPVVTGPGGSAASTPRSSIVPTRCLVRRGGLAGVFVVQEGRATLRWLRLGRTDGASVEVLAGISPGEEVVVDPGDLEDGTPVTAGR
jgi:RND family efflux transporter MFP subunit